MADNRDQTGGSQAIDLEHKIMVKHLATLLADPQLQDDDLLIPNAVGNMKVMRGGRYIGYIDLLPGSHQVIIFAREGGA